MTDAEQNAPNVAIGDFQLDVDMDHKWMNWADEVERLTISDVPNGDNEETDRSAAVRQHSLPIVDLSKVPTEPPFTAIVFNIPLDVTEADLADFFTADGVKKVNFVRNGTNHFQGTSYVEFIDRETLISALYMSGKTLSTRTIRVEVSKTVSTGRQMSGGGSRSGRPTRDTHGRRQHSSSAYGGRRFSETGFSGSGGGGGGNGGRRNVVSNDVRNAPEFQSRRCSVDVARDDRRTNVPKGLPPMGYNAPPLGANQAGPFPVGGGRIGRQMSANYYMETHSAVEAKPQPYDHAQSWQSRGGRVPPASLLYERPNPVSQRDSYRTAGGRMAPGGGIAQGGNGRRQEYNHYPATLPRSMAHSGGDYAAQPRHEFSQFGVQHQQWPAAEQQSMKRPSTQLIPAELLPAESSEQTRSSMQADSKSKIFGEAKPVDTDKRLREIEQQRMAAARCMSRTNSESQASVTTDTADTTNPPLAEGHVKLLKRPPQPVAVTDEPTAPEPEALARIIEKQRNREVSKAGAERMNYKARGGHGERGKRGRRDRGRGQQHRSLGAGRGGRSQLNATSEEWLRGDEEQEITGNCGNKVAATPVAPVDRSGDGYNQQPNEASKVDHESADAKRAVEEPSEGHYQSGKVRRPVHQRHYVRQFWRGGNRSFSNPQPNDPTDHSGDGAVEKRFPSHSRQSTTVSVVQEEVAGSVPEAAPPLRHDVPTAAKTNTRSAGGGGGGGSDGRRGSRGSHHRKHNKVTGRQAFTDRNKYDLLNTVNVD